MGRPAYITLATARSRARSISPRILLVNAVLFNLASAVLGVIWSIGMTLGHGWGVGAGIGAGTVLTLSLSSLWFIASLGWMLIPRLSGVQRMTRGWMTAVLITALASIPIVGPWWVALAALFVGFAASSFLSKTATRMDETKMTGWDLPASLLPMMRAVPERLPIQVEAILDLSFRDWMHLRDLIGFTSESAIRAFVDIQAISRDAERTVSYLLKRAPVVAKLVELANERADSESRKAADTALGRLRQVGDVLHEAVTAVGQFAASEERNEAHELMIRVEGLKELASTLETDGFEVELNPSTLDDIRFRVRELKPEPIGVREVVEVEAVQSVSEGDETATR